MRAAFRAWIPIACTALSCAGTGPAPRERTAATREASSAARQERLPPESPPVLQLPRDVHPLHYALSMRIVPENDRFAGDATIDVRLDRARDVI